MQVVELFDERVSRSLVKDFSSLNRLGAQEPVYLYKTMMDLCESDPILFTAVNLTVDLCTYNGYTFIGENKEGIKKAKKLFDDELDFDKVIDNILWQIIIYGDSYLECRWNESKTEIIELNPLETPEMKINFTEHGDIVGFTQAPPGKGESEQIIFPLDEIVYFRAYWVGTQVYSKCPFKAIARSYATKVYANNFLQSIFLNLPPKIVYFLKNANEKQRKEFWENLIRAKTNPNMDLVATGEAFDSKILEPSFDSGLMQILEFLRKEILTITRVPPHWVGILDGANRGIGENVVIPYETKIKKIQQYVASEINRTLMPRLNLPDVTFKWNAISLMDEKSIVEIMNMLNAQGFDSETIVQYAYDHGLNLREGAVISKITTPETQDDTSPSRIRKNDKTDRLKSEINKKGVSEAGAEKLEEKKVI